ncbi:MAG TPA: hypothetical protein V6C81_13160 [Planktothrix sp.]|jgi:hypothetical protein
MVRPPTWKRRFIALSLVALMFFAGWVAQHVRTDTLKAEWIAVLVLSLLSVLGMVFENADGQ